MVSRGRHETNHEHRRQRSGAERRARDGQRRLGPARCARRPPLRPDFLLPGPAVRGAHVDHPGKVVPRPAIANRTRILAYGYLSSQGLLAVESGGADEASFRLGASEGDGNRRIHVRGACLVRDAGIRCGRFGPIHRDSARLEQRRPRDPGGRSPGERMGPRRGSRDSLVGLRQRGGFLDALNATGVKRNLNVSVDGAPTGIVFNGASTSFRVGPSNAGAVFIFATEGGTIAGWNPSLGTAAEVKVDSSGAGAIYKGLAIATTATGPQLYATDFHNARVDVFDATWAAVQTAGGFVDPTIPAGYAPFGIQTIGTRIFVTFAKQGLGAKDEIDGQGLGFVDAFDSDGNLVARVAQHGQLNAPWGLALAPASFGRFGGDLLVGNFGDGHVNAYQEISDGTFELIGALRTADGRKLAIDGLWALQFGHGTVNNGPVDTLFFTAGPNDEADGLFGTITAA